MRKHAQSSSSAVLDKTIQWLLSGNATSGNKLTIRANAVGNQMPHN